MVVADKRHLDKTFQWANSLDPTKRIEHNLALLAAGITRTITWRDGNIDFSDGGTFGTSPIPGNVNTTDATPAVAGQIITLTDNTNHTIVVNIVCEEGANVKGGSWVFTLRVTVRSGTLVIQGQSLDFFDGGAGLLGTSVEFVVVNGTIDIEVTGIAATTFIWKTLHEIILIVG